MKIIDARVRLPQNLRQTNSYQSMQTDQYDRILALSDKMNAATLDILIESMQAHNVEFAVMHAETEGNESADFLNSAIAKVVSAHPDKFAGVGTVDLHSHRISTVIRQVNDISELGLKGISVQSAFSGMDINEKFLYPLYAKAEEMGLILAVHTGITYSRAHKLSHEKPELLDAVACDFPDLKIIAAHAGWPWATEMAAVASRHPTVYLEFGAIAPKYVARAGTGWDAMFALMPNRLSQQILFGSDWPMMPHDRLLNEWNESGLNVQTLQALFFDNAKKLFGLELK